MNNCIFIGRLTAEPEIRMTTQGIMVARFTLAVDRRMSKENKATDFFDIEAWRGSAEFAEKYFRKGMRVAVQWEMRTRTYTDKEGIKRKAYTLTAENLEFADGRKGAGADSQIPDTDGGFANYGGESPFM